MSGYSGHTSFDFEIERYKNKKTGVDTAYLLPGINEDDYDYHTLTLKVEGSAYFAPGKTYGPPENCYPDEGDVEITSCLGPDGKDWEDQLTHSERDAIIEMIDGNVQEGLDGPDPDDYDDREDLPDDYYEPSFED
jgi:hypothetical protein